MDWRKINLAPFRYAKVHADCGGPISKIICNHTHQGFEAFAFLDQKIISEFSLPEYKLYGNSHGMGTSKIKLQAIYKAISEALERWAFYSCIHEGHPVCQNDKSTDGFAAFPGLWPNVSKILAFCEALERWSLGAWWQEKLQVVKIQDRTLSIQTPFAGYKMLLLWEDSEIYGRAYGFACRPTWDESFASARNELFRNQQVLKSSTVEASALKNIYEKRLLFFSGSDGQKIFDEKIRRTTSSTKNFAAKPKLIYDHHIEGGWTKYTYVWRCLFEIEADYSVTDPTFFKF